MTARLAIIVISSGLPLSRAITMPAATCSKATPPQTAIVARQAVLHVASSISSVARMIAWPMPLLASTRMISKVATRAAW